MGISTTNVGNAVVIQATETYGGGVYSSVSTSIAIDYTAYYSRIATALETIASNTTVMASNSTDMKNSLNTLATLGSGNGIHMIGPWDYIGLYEVVRKLEQDHIPFQEFLDKIKNLPKDF